MPYIIAAIIIIIIGITCIKVVPQKTTMIVERMGAYMATWEVGIHFKLPIIDRVAKVVNMKEQVADFPPQPVITRDNVSMRIDTVIFFQIMDPKLYAYGVTNPLVAIENIVATNLRSIIGQMELDATLSSRDEINNTMTRKLDEDTDRWGIKVLRVEVKNIIPPASIQEAMEKQMKADREKREAILIAGGEREAAILRAEGKKQSAILEAEAEKEAAILRAEAKKEATIREAEGQAEAILAVQRANAEGIKLINEANPSNAVLQMKSLEAFEKAANGSANKIIIPSDIQGLAGLAKSITEVAK